VRCGCRRGAASANAGITSRANRSHRSLRRAKIERADIDLSEACSKVPIDSLVEGTYPSAERDRFGRLNVSPVNFTTCWSDKY